MKLWATLILFLCFGNYASSQGTALNALAEALPPCSLACFKSAIPESSCASNLTSECLCTNTALNAAVGLCVLEKCSVYEGLQTKNVSSTSCGVEVRSDGHRFIVIAMVGIALAVLSYILRMAASLHGRQLSWDDATMALVVCLAIPPAVFAFMLVDNGLGRDMWTLKDYQITNVLLYYYAGEVFYILSLGISKISILFFYLRVFPAKELRMQIYGLMALCSVYTIAFTLVTTIQCLPISYAWTQWDGLHEGNCNDIHLQGWIAAACNILLDVLVMLFPLKHLYGLNMSLRKKLMVMAMFSVGAIVVFTSAMRLYSLVHFANSQNITWDYVEAGYWSLIEIDVSIICGCMPAHRMLLARTWPKIKMTFHSTKGTMNSGRFAPGSKSTSGLGNNKEPQISIKPQTKDERDFVPLVNMESRGMCTSALNGQDSERKDAWAKLTVKDNNASRTNVSAAGTCDSDPSDGWPIKSSINGGEYV